VCVCVEPFGENLKQATKNVEIIQENGSSITFILARELECTKGT
jgi:hypothetical protein